jgi:hypothetical protein
MEASNVGMLLLLSKLTDAPLDRRVSRSFPWLCVLCCLMLVVMCQHEQCSATFASQLLLFSLPVAADT